MLLEEDFLEQYPKPFSVRGGLDGELRPLTRDDETVFHEFFLAIPDEERIFIKHRVVDPAVIHDWCQNIDYGRNLPLLAIYKGQVIGSATLHQQLGGWKRHIGRVSALVHPNYRARGLASAMVAELMDVARSSGLERLEAEFLGQQERAMKIFGMLGFSQLLHISDYVKDMQAIPHDYVLMGMNLKTDEEYAGMG